jgi:hypothetical protein
MGVRGAWRATGRRALKQEKAMLPLRVTKPPQPRSAIDREKSTGRRARAGPRSISANAPIEPPSASRLDGDDRSRRAAKSAQEDAGVAGDVVRRRGKGKRRPPLPATAITPGRGSLRCARTTPTDSRCPLTPRCSPRGRGRWLMPSPQGRLKVGRQRAFVPDRGARTDAA